MPTCAAGLASVLWLQLKKAPIVETGCGIKEYYFNYEKTTRTYWENHWEGRPLNTQMNIDGMQEKKNPAKNNENKRTFITKAEVESDKQQYRVSEKMWNSFNRMKAGKLRENYNFIDRPELRNFT